jgi:hypothetical protein
MNPTERRRARRAAFDAGDPDLIAAVLAEQAADAAAQRERDRANVAAARQLPPAYTTWEEVARAVDEGTWLRILDDFGPNRGTLEAIRAPAGRHLPTTEQAG